VALYTNDSKERVRDAVDMVDLVSSRTELKRAGVNRLTGLCPFHDERTPSFGINPVEKVYHCFGCQASGDAFTFVMETEGVDFKSALELLADRYKVTLELEDEDPAAAQQRQQRDRLLELLERTTTFYVRQLWESREAANARAYLQERGLEEATLREFRVGYAPSAWGTVLDASRRAGFANRAIYEAGLAQKSQKTGRIYDRFRSQIIFPLADSRGRVRGFAGRTLGGPDDRRPKYVNSPESDLFHKRSQLFAADLARGPAAKAGSVVAAEGYTDVIAMHQAGIRNSVAIMGTSLTEEQVGELARLAPVVALALDADDAGQDAGLRADPLVLTQRLSAARRLTLQVIPLPSGEDPADLIQRHGGEEMKRRCAAAVPYVYFSAQRMLERADLKTAEGKSVAYRELQALIGKLRPDQLFEREEILRMAGSQMELSDQHTASLIARHHEADPRRPGFGEFVGDWSNLNRQESQERSFLALCIALPALGAPALAELDLEADLTSAITRRAADHLRDHLAAPTTELADDDPLQTLMRELAVGDARAHEATPAAFDIERVQLTLARLDREIAAARNKASSEIPELARRRSEAQRQLAQALERAMDEGATPR
jgi:DNA primase